MVYAQVLVLALAYVGMASAHPGGVIAAAPAIIAAEPIAYPRYAYSYGVSDAITGDQKTASEVRDGGIVKGHYSLVQPDGVLRTVNYVSDPINGFQAQVLNTGTSVLAKKVVAAAPIVAAAPVIAAAPHGLGLGLGARIGLAQTYGHLGGLVGLNGLALNTLGLGVGLGGAKIIG